MGGVTGISSTDTRKYLENAFADDIAVAINDGPASARADDVHTVCNIEVAVERGIINPYPCQEIGYVGLEDDGIDTRVRIRLLDRGAQGADAVARRRFAYAIAGIYVRNVGWAVDSEGGSARVS